MNRTPSTGTDEQQQAEGRSWALALMPSPFVLSCALAAGLLCAWWLAFHEIACGGISIRSEVPLPFTYASCYAFSLGCVAGAGATELLARGTGEWGACTRKRLAAGLFAAMAVSTLSYFPLVEMGLWLPSVIAQTLMNAAAVCLLLPSVELLGRLSPSDATSALLVGLAVYGVLDNGLLPMVIWLTGSTAAVPAVLALVAMACGLLIARIVKTDAFQALVSTKQPTRPDAQTRQDGARPRIAPQPLAHLTAYGFVFGLMHVESSSLVHSFYARDLPYAAGCLLAGALFAWCFIRPAANGSIWPRMRTVVFPLTVTGFLSLPLLDTATSWVPVALVDCGYLFWCLLVVLAVLYVSRESRLGTRRAAAIGLVVVQLSYFVGTVASRIAINLLPVDPMHTLQWSMAVFLLLVATTLWLGDDRRARKLWGMRVELTPRQLHEARLEGACNLIASRWKLTPKEREVVLLLAEGKRANQIAEELFVSVNTTRTHIRNVYARLDVHSYKELADLVQAMSAEVAKAHG